MFPSAARDYAIDGLMRNTQFCGKISIPNFSFGVLFAYFNNLFFGKTVGV